MAHFYKGELTLEEEKKAKTAKAPAEAAEKKEPVKKAPAKKAEPKAEPAEAKKPSAAALKAALAQMEEQETGKKKNTVLLRVLAFVMWALAIVAMYLPQIGDLELPFGAMRMLVLKNYTPMIIDIVVAVALCIGAALLWKKANHIHPVKSHNKIVQFIWNQLGLIMAFLIFFVIGLVLILKNDKLDAKTKKIAIAALAVITLLVGGVSADYHPVTQDEVNKVTQEFNIDAQDPDGCFWTTFGKKYHLYGDCQALTNTSAENLHQTSLQEAWNNNRGELCSFCAKRAADSGATDTTAITPTNP
jgi:hypothetical protein